MSILWRLNAMIAGLVLALLAAFTVTMLMQAAPRIQNENESMSRLAREFFLKSLDALSHAPDPALGLEELIDDLQGVRHIRITLVRPATPAEGFPKAARHSQAGVEPSLQPSARENDIRLPVLIRGQNLGMVVIAPQPSDEIAEIWDAAAGVAQTGFLISVAAFGLIGWATRRALEPIGALSMALTRMQEGDYDVGVETLGPPEISGIAVRLNTLAAVLRRVRLENRHLSQKLIEAQDLERRDIARELHDELGPVLFAVRATGTSLKTAAEKSAGDQQKIGRLATSMLEQIEVLQITNRRVLRRLSPVGLDELGLTATIEGMIALWQKQHPEVTLSLDASPEIDKLDRTTTLTVYRMIQESITNALKHGRPSHIDVLINYAERPSGYELAATVTDNGSGLTDNARPGLGLTSMRERIEALSGTLTVAPGPNGGTVLAMLLKGPPSGPQPTSTEPSAAHRS